MKQLLCILSLSLAVLGLQAKTIKIPVGPMRTAHEAMPIVLSLNDYPEISLSDRALLGVYDGKQEISSQLDDINGDGIADEICFLVDLRAGEKKTLRLKAQKKHKDFEKEVYAEMYLKSKTEQEGYQYWEAEGKQFYITPVTEQTFAGSEDSYHQMHHHGVAFESALMAYRIYFDKKQTIDIYAKRTPGLEIEECKWYPTDEQLERGFGDDILRVSGTIGVGACKPFNGEKMVHFDEVDMRTERIVSQGNIRTICEIEDRGWLLPNGHKINLITRYTLYARHRDVLVEVFFSEPVDGMCTGVQRIDYANYYTAMPARHLGDSVPPSEPQKVPGGEMLLDVCPTGGIAASWGTAFPVNDSVKYGKETVGLAVYVPELDYYRSVVDQRNNLIILQAGQYIRYYLTVVSLKEQNAPAHTAEEFFEFVRQWAKELE